MVVPIEVPPEIVDGGALESALSGLVGALAGLLRPATDALVRVAKWVYQEAFRGLIIVTEDVENLSVNVASRFATVLGEISEVANHASTTVIEKTVTVTGNVDAQVDALGREIVGAENYTIGIAEDLYNRAVARADTVGQEVLADAWQLYDSAVHAGEAAAAGVRSYAIDLYNRVSVAAENAYDDAVTVAQALQVDALHYADTLVAPLAGEIADLKPWAQGLMALTGAEILARAITITKDLYDECCSFTTDDVKPAWNTVKNMLGKLTSRGPLLMVVMGAAAETVVEWDRSAIVDLLKQAQANQSDADRTAIRQWARLS